MPLRGNSRIDEILRRQEEALLKLEGQQARHIMGIYEEARRELAEALDAKLVGIHGNKSFTAHQLRVALAQSQAAAFSLRERLNDGLTASEHLAHERGLHHLLKQIRAGDGRFKGGTAAIETPVLKRLARDRALLLHQHSTARYTADIMAQVQRQLGLGLATKQTRRQIVERIAGREGSVLAGFRGRARLIVQMEMSRAYNQAHQTSLEAATKVLDDPGDPDGLKRQASEARDHRNHPFSRALHGKIATIDGPWVVPHAEVLAAAVKMGKPAGLRAILWQRQGENWVGSLYPAHFNDRGRQIPYRASWYGEAPAPIVPVPELPKSPPAPKTPPAKPPRMTPKRQLDKARADLARLGLSKTAWGIGADVEHLADNVINALKRNGHRIPPTLPLVSPSFRVGPPAAPGTSRFHRKLLSDLEALPVGVGGPMQSALLFSLKQDIAAHDAFEAAYRGWARSTTPEQRSTERKRWLKVLLPRSVRGEKKSELISASEKALVMYSPDLLLLLAREGERIKNQPLRRGYARAFAKGGNLTVRGEVHIHLPWVVTAARDARPTLAHELAHRLDGIFGGADTADSGHPWRARPAYPEAPEWWRRAYGIPFEEAKASHRSVQMMPHRETRSPFMWAGTWVKAYEARIYSPGTNHPNLAVLASNRGGPIEFIAQSATYRTQFATSVTSALRSRQLTAGGAKLTPSMVNHIVERQKWSKALTLYGSDYTGGVSDWIGPSALDELKRVAPTAPFSDDADILGYAAIFRLYLGVPLKESLKASGPLGKRLSTPWTGARLSEDMIPEVVAGNSAHKQAFKDLLTRLESL